VEKGASGRAMLGTVPSLDLKPRGRGRPRKDTEKGEEDCLPTRMNARPSLEDPLMLTN
jgi:hypothetical protein